MLAWKIAESLVLETRASFAYLLQEFEDCDLRYSGHSRHSIDGDSVNKGRKNLCAFLKWQAIHSDHILCLTAQACQEENAQGFPLVFLERSSYS